MHTDKGRVLRLPAPARLFLPPSSHNLKRKSVGLSNILPVTQMVDEIHQPNRCYPTPSLVTLLRPTDLPLILVRSLGQNERPCPDRTQGARCRTQTVFMDSPQPVPVPHRRPSRGRKQLPRLNLGLGGGGWVIEDLWNTVSIAH